MYILWILDNNCIDGIDPTRKRVVDNKNVDFLAESVTCLSFEIYNEIFVKKIEITPSLVLLFG